MKNKKKSALKSKSLGKISTLSKPGGLNHNQTFVSVR